MKKKISMLLACAMTVNCMSAGMTALASPADDAFGYEVSDEDDDSDPEEDDDDYEANDYNFGDPAGDLEEMIENFLLYFGDPEEDVDDDLEPQVTGNPTPTPTHAPSGGSDAEEDEDLEEPVDYGALYSGTWVNENGFACIIDTTAGTYTDAYGCRYSLMGISEHGIVVCETSDESAFNDAMVPVHGMLTIGCELSEDGTTLSIGNNDAVKLDSEEGQEIAERVFDLLSGKEFSMGTDHAVISFNEDMTEMEDELIIDGPLNISFDGIGIHFLDIPGYTAYIRIVEDVPMMAYEGSLIPMADGTVNLTGGLWVYYEGASDTAVILDYTDPDNPVVVDPATGESGALTQIAPDISYSGEISLLSYDSMQFMGGYAASGVFFAMDPVAAAAGEQSDDISYEVCYLLMQADSPYAGEIVRRYTASCGSRGMSTECNDLFCSGALTYDRYDDEWHSDIVYARELTKYFVNYNEDLALVPLTCAVYVVRYDDRDITISFDYDGDIPDTAAIYYIENYISGEGEALETSFEHGYAECELGETGIYVLAEPLPAVELTIDNFFDTDPMDTAWGMSEFAGDIPSLVDLDYLQEEIGDDMFVVTTAEELASVTYLINTYPFLNNVIIDLQADIDLSGYDWAPMGVPSEIFGARNYFGGFFFGNGHTITGLNIDNSYPCNAFFGNIIDATVIGLGIEGAEISGRGSCILAVNPENCDFADCHVIGELPDAYGNLPGRMGISYPAGGNTYRDCYCSITTADGDYEADIDFVSEYAPENNAISFFDPEGDGTYDYSEDFMLI
ncbi:MAG: hypothetical protein J5685_02580 [Clostridiales bacterium]|nr:hypothetical protein [Clostridiales bacterium]